jgi:tripartite-type tricarboxylate transporter receptor subunit TctC
MLLPPRAIVVAIAALCAMITHPHRRPLMRRLLLALLLVAPPLAAEPWPVRPLTIMSGFPNGSGIDIYARMLAEPLARALEVPVVIDNRVGAGGNVASDLVAKARPDGSIVLFGTAGTHAINASLYRSLPFDVVNDFAPVTLLGDLPNVLLVNPERTPQFTDCRALIAFARANPGRLNYASTGNGASTHLAGAQFAAAAGIEMQHVPYRGGPFAMTALLTGEVQLFLHQVPPAMGPIAQGQVRALGVTVRAPVAALPGVPTMEAACDLPGFESTTWYGLLLPARTPDSLIRRLNAAVVAIVRDADFSARLVAQGVVPLTSTPEAMRAQQLADISKWREIVARSGARAE